MQTSAMKLAQLLTLTSFLIQFRQNFAIFPGNIANQYYIEKQRFLLEILHHLHEPLLNEEWRTLGQELVIDESQYVHFNQYMRQFQQFLSQRRLITRHVYYSSQYADHYQQTLGLYQFFYNSREWSTLRQNICWARMHMNPALFLHALTQTMLKRDDYRVLILPKVYELLPAPYYSESIVREASKFNHDNWLRHEQLSGNQSTKLQLVQPKKLLPTNIAGALRSISQWSEAMSEVEILSLTNIRKTAEFAYLTEDVGWLSYWYYINMGLALPVEPKNTKRLRDWWYWQLSQLVNRYKLERYGQGKKYSRLYSLDKEEVRHLLTCQNHRYEQETKATTQYFTWFLDKLEMNVEQALFTRRYTLSNGSDIDLRRADNWLLGLAELFPYDLSLLQIPSAQQPQQLLDLHTMLGYTHFYSYADRLLHAYRSYRSTFQPSYSQPVKAFDLRIQGLTVSPLITYDEPVNMDLSNVLHVRHFYNENQFTWPYSLQARTCRLQQRPFSINFQVFSNKTQSIILRTYLTTVSGDINEEPFYQLDSFLALLYAGKNNIARDSQDFQDKIGDHISYTELYKYTKLAEQKLFDFPLNITIPSCGFPRRLILPKGDRLKALPMRLFVIATPYNFQATQGNELNCDFSNGLSSWDELPFGYPFEKRVHTNELFDKHTYWQTVEIRHEEFLSI